MNPPMHGCATYEYNEWVYLIGGVDSLFKSSDIIYRLSRDNPVRMEKFHTMKAKRSFPKAFRVGGKIVIIGGSLPPLIEAYHEDSFKEDDTVKAKSDSFFYQLRSYTTDLKLGRSTIG